VLRSLLLVVVVALACLMLADRARQHAPIAVTAVVSAPDSVPGVVAPRSTIPVVSTIPPDTATPALDLFARLAVRRRLVREGDRVYLDSLFPHTDSVVTRWPDRSVLTVAMIDDTSLTGWTPALMAEGRAALHAWEGNAGGISMREVAAPDSADIVVQWVVTLPVRGQVGSTTLGWNPDGVVRHASVTLALRRNSDSLAVPAAARARIAIHELGHAIGLPHSDNSDDIMFFTSPVDGPSARDQATLRLLYAVPPGPLRVSP
jgi:hypothetical protein